MKEVGGVKTPCSDEYVSHDGKTYRCEEEKGHSKFRKHRSHRSGSNAWSVMWSPQGKARIYAEREGARVQAIVEKASV